MKMKHKTMYTVNKLAYTCILIFMNLDEAYKQWNVF